MDEEGSKVGDAVNDIITVVAFALILMFLSSCGLDSGFAPGEHPNFWTQCVKLDGWGFTMATPYGPFNVGKATYERNVNCDRDINQQEPTIPK